MHSGIFQKIMFPTINGLFFVILTGICYSEQIFYEMKGNRIMSVEVDIPLDSWLCMNINMIVSNAVFFNLTDMLGAYFMVTKKDDQIFLKHKRNQVRTGSLTMERNVTYKFCVKFSNKNAKIKLGNKEALLQVRSFVPIVKIEIGSELSRRNKTIGFVYDLHFKNEIITLSTNLSRNELKYPKYCGTCIKAKCDYFNDIETKCFCNRYHKHVNNTHCMKDFCTTNICENNGECLLDNGTIPHCFCKKPFTGIYCGCNPNYCHNKGTCKQNKDRKVDCICSLGYYGKRCRCKNEFCHNNGKCLESDSGNLTCRCKSGYSGTRCICGPDSCVNGGYCSEINGTSFKCHCTKGFSGKYCGCPAGYCKNGNCTDKNKSPKCKCFQSFSGKTCMCNKAYCNNHGFCNEKNGHLSCECFDKYNGDLCSCSDEYCSDNGRCNEYGKNRTCTCNTDFSGKRCKCHRSICIHGKCTEINKTFHCICNKGYIGRRCSCPESYCKNNSTCEIKDVPSCKCSSKESWGQSCLCTKAYCNYNGKCSENRRKRRCSCSKGYYGDFCQCKPNFCQNNGTCIKNKRIQQCKCINGYEANDCSCKPGYCSGRGKCQRKNNKFICKCFGENVGKYCRCKKTYCLNGGLCQFNETRNDMYCICKLPYTGPRCSCNPNYCMNGVCVVDRNNTDKYRCICHKHYEGQKCEIKKSTWNIVLPYILIMLKTIIAMVSILIIVIICITIRNKQIKEKFMEFIQKTKTRYYNFKTTMSNIMFGNPITTSVTNPDVIEMDELFTNIGKKSKPNLLEKLRLETTPIEVNYFTATTAITESDISLLENNVILEQTDKPPIKRSNLKKESLQHNLKGLNKRHIKFAKLTKEEEKMKKELKEECHAS